jgi:hypothetical protein
MRPWLLRPPDLPLSDSVSDFSGFFLVISEYVWEDAFRRPGEVGLYCLMGIA